MRPFVERGFVAIGGGVQAAGASLTDRLFFEANAETGTVETEYPRRAGLLIDAGAGMRVRGRIGMALAISHGTASGGATVSAEIPHPFFDDQHRTVSGEAGDISRTETAAHLQVYYDLRPKGPWRMRLFAGPSYFNVEQELVTSVQAAETFPFDTAELGSTTSERTNGSGLGFNAGIDASRMVTRRVGVGAILRYARASLDLNAPGSRNVSSDGGGLEAALGLRLLF